MSFLFLISKRRPIGWKVGLALAFFLTGHLSDMVAKPNHFWPNVATPEKSLGWLQNEDAARRTRSEEALELAIRQQSEGDRQGATENLEVAWKLQEGSGLAEAKLTVLIGIRLASLYLEQGEAKQAEEVAQMCSGLARRAGLYRELAQIHILLSELQRMKGRLDEATREAGSALQSLRKSASGDAALIEGTQNQLGRIAFEGNNLEGAERYWKEVLEARRRRMPAGDLSLLGLRVDLARISVLQGKQTEAEQQLLEVLETAENERQPQASANALYVYGLMRVKQKKWEKARELLQQSLRLSDQFEGERSANSALCLLELAKLQEREKKIQAATAYTGRPAPWIAAGEPVALVWIELAELHVKLLSKLGNKQEARMMAASVDKAKMSTRVRREMIDIRELAPK